MYARIQKNKIVEYPYDINNLRKSVSLPDTLTPEVLLEHNIVEVESSERPQGSYTEITIEGQPKLVNGVWKQTWIVESAPENVIQERTDEKSAVIRSIRNERIRKTDWTQLPDVQVNQQSWAVYRQSLRDIPSQPGFPWDVEWPTPPTGTPEE